jgi:hypothetical protein
MKPTLPELTARLVNPRGRFPTLQPAVQQALSVCRQQTVGIAELFAMTVCRHRGIQAVTAVHGPRPVQLGVHRVERLLQRR